MFLTVVALAVVALLGGAAYVTLGPTGDPLTEWALATEKLCVQQLNAVGALDVPDVEDPDALEATGEQIAATLDELAAALGRAEVPGAAAELNELVADQARVRAEIYRKHRSDPAAEITESLTKVATELAQLPAPSCSRFAYPGANAQAAVDAWYRAVEAACLSAAQTYLEADRAAVAGTSTRDEYLAAVRAATRALHSDLTAEGDIPDPALGSAWSALVDSTDALPAAIDAGELDRAVELSRTWAAAAAQIGLAGCDDGISVDAAAPSGILEVPDLVGLPVVGAEGGMVNDAARFAGLLGDLMVSSGGRDPLNSFGAAELLSQLGVGTTDGPATPEAVSLGGAGTVTGAEPSADNPHELRVAVRDSSGACTTLRVWGYPALVGSEQVASNPECSTAR